jgi:hypothetical protein
VSPVTASRNSPASPVGPRGVRRRSRPPDRHRSGTSLPQDPFGLAPPPGSPRRASGQGQCPSHLRTPVAWHSSEGTGS